MMVPGQRREQPRQMSQAGILVGQHPCGDRIVVKGSTERGGQLANAGRALIVTSSG